MNEPGRAQPLILVVEDNDTIRNAFSILLGESGYEVAQAASGAEALDRSRSLLPDLVLMDLGLPDVNGLEVTRQMKADKDTRDIPIIALTGRALETNERECLDAGCVGFLAKPIDTEQLLRRIPAFLKG